MVAFRQRGFETGTRPAVWFGRLALLALSCLALVLVTLPAAATEKVLAVSYDITVAGIPVGHIDVVGHFIDGAYAVALTGYTGGVTRLVMDATATMSADGNIRGTEVLPAHYQVDMTEAAEPSQARMALRDRSVTDLYVDPGLVPSLQRVPLTMDHVHDVVDPMSALFVATGTGDVSGEWACNRTLAIFDGWQRYDVEMTYVTTRTVFGTRDGYSGPSFVCGARYTPIAGHDLTTPAVAYMSDNSRLEASLVPVAGLAILIPYQMLIGTEIGDLVIRLERMSLADTPDAVAGR
jgi:hypothetical protein